MRFRRAVSAVLLAAVLFSAVFSVPASAAGIGFDVVVSSATGIPGDSVVFNVDIVGNPGIMAVTVTFHYDPNILEYEAYYAGILSKDTLARHSGYISVVYCGRQDLTGDGTLFSMKMKIKDSAQVGTYAVTVKNNRCEDTLEGAFANWNVDRLSGNAVPGSVTVGYNGENCKHRFTAYEAVVPAGCTTDGVDSRSCTVCGHTETVETPKLGHQYEENWTIDTAATADESGVMSRHCVRCDAVTDKVRFTAADAVANGFSNTVGTVLAPGSWEPLQPSAPVPEELAAVPEEPQTSADSAAAGEAPEDLPQVQEITADELVDSVRLESQSGLARLYTYLFGSGAGGGIVGLIASSAPRALLRSVALLLAAALIALLCFVL